MKLIVACVDQEALLKNRWAHALFAYVETPLHSSCMHSQSTRMHIVKPIDSYCCM